MIKDCIVGLFPEFAAMLTHPPTASEREGDEPPLLGHWHHGEGILVSGTIRIARWDCDTNPPDTFRDKALDWMCSTLNRAVKAHSDAQRLGREKGNGND